MTSTGTRSDEDLVEKEGNLAGRVIPLPTISAGSVRLFALVQRSAWSKHPSKVESYYDP